MADINDLLSAASESDPLEFGSKFDELMRERSVAAVEARKLELAKAIYGSSDDDIELDNEDLDDEELDIDLDDLDIEDEEIDDPES